MYVEDSEIGVTTEMEVKVSAIEQQAKSLLTNNNVVELLKHFIDITHWCYYLLRFPQIRAVNSFLTGQKPGSHHMNKMTTDVGTYEDIVFLRVFQMPDRGRFYGTDKPRRDPMKMEIDEYLAQMREVLICERCFYDDNYEFKPDSSEFAFREKFDYLLEVIQKNTFLDINPLSLLLALYNTAIPIYAQRFYSKWNDTIPIDDCASFFAHMRPYLDPEKDLYKEVGEITCYFLHKNWFEHKSFFQGYDDVTAKIQTATDDFEKSTFIDSLLKPHQQKIVTEVTIDDIDIMDGVEFERFVGNLFARQGYLITYTRTTGDQGVDIIAEKGGVRFGIQTKRYTGNVSNTAIQEITAGKAHHRCDKAIVITNSFFTNSAIELAASNNVILWDRTLIKEKLREARAAQVNE